MEHDLRAEGWGPEDCYPETADVSKSELSDLLAALGVTDEWRVENIKETAMFRCNMKKSRREHIRKVLDEAFSLLKREAANNQQSGARVR